MKRLQKKKRMKRKKSPTKGRSGSAKKGKK